jgi:hypothetical protein
MKKIILVAFIAFGIVSCSSEDEDNDTIQTSPYATVSAKFNSFDANKSLTGKTIDVKRGSIPATINTIAITSNHSDISVPDYTTTFNIVADNTAGAGTVFNIQHVTSGTNLFSAIALTTATPSTTFGTVADLTNAQMVSFLNAKQGLVPYVKYTADVSQNMSLGTAQEVKFDMATSNGRILASVETGPTLTAMNRKVTVTAQRFLSGTIGTESQDKTTPVTITNAVPLLESNGGATDTPGTIISSLAAPTGTPINVTGTANAWMYWSNENSIVGGFVYLKTDIYAVDGLTIEKSFYTIIKVQANRGIASRVSVTVDGITEDIDYGTFTFPDWTNDAVN